MTKLRLGAIPDEKPVKLTVELPGGLMREIVDYARVHAKLNALTSPLAPERIVPAMIERFIASDREFSKQRSLN
jgi:hypothetical protein